MKKWTVMLVPQGLGSTRSVNLYAFQLWLVVALLATLAFGSTFFFQRYRVARLRVHELERTARQLATANGAVPKESGLSELEVQNIEQKYREEYNASIEAITTELSELYDLEAQIRKVHGLPPKVKSSTDYVQGGTGGKGGPPDDLEEEVESGDDELMRPSHWIYGMSHPSADLIVQEINLREASLMQLLDATEEQRDRIARTPAIWPSLSGRRAISSRYGTRRDPFTKRLRHHDGLDVTAPYKSSVVATAKGKVVESTRDQWLGHIVKIDHGYGLISLYGHLQDRLVEVGDEVERGDVIGKLGNTGRSTGPHIHYEVHKNGKRVDPENYLGN